MRSHSPKPYLLNAAHFILQILLLAAPSSYQILPGSRFLVVGNGISFSYQMEWLRGIDSSQNLWEGWKHKEQRLSFYNRNYITSEGCRRSRCFGNSREAAYQIEKLPTGFGRCEQLPASESHHRCWALCRQQWKPHVLPRSPCNSVLSASLKWVHLIVGPTIPGTLMLRPGSDDSSTDWIEA